MVELGSPALLVLPMDSLLSCEQSSYGIEFPPRVERTPAQELLGGQKVFCYLISKEAINELTGMNSW
jgi:hypothetical protein